MREVTSSVELCAVSNRVGHASIESDFGCESTGVCCLNGFAFFECECSTSKWVFDAGLMSASLASLRCNGECRRSFLMFLPCFNLYLYSSLLFPSMANRTPQCLDSGVWFHSFKGGGVCSKATGDADCPRHFGDLSYLRDS